MKMVYSNESSFLVNNTKNLIEAEGINTFIKNEFSQGAMGEVSVFDSWPELWIFDDEDLPRALEIVSLSQNSVNKSDWVCQQCSEENPAAFDLCWNCQSEKTKKVS
ncbi:putative signal transducing protein [Psychromonas algicola]|uniref:putative signal transducing protein n=1 Tax=Psychromonas algicola TaxID=2555642 RepID=UPI00106771DE|nr:DUF2007 domain-containing protein [Psychromonas sp. RZ5]TEW44304.1 DUF2007 domain-containing protein [Psychromonas sp. RZ5]